MLIMLGNEGPPSEGPPTREARLTARITTFTSALSARQPYRSPKADERRNGARGFTDLVDAGRAIPTVLTDLGFSVVDDVDAETGRPYTLAVNEPDSERAWGMYVIDRSAPPSVVVEVPHPASDLRTELSGLALFRQVTGAVLLIAGAHRRADGRKADVAHEENSLFHVVATELARRGLPQVQLHGYHDENAPDRDIVISSGATQAGDQARRAADGLAVAGFAVCRAWDESCTGLEGTTNVQGKAAAQAGTVFLHVEMSRTIREDGQRRAAVAKVLADARLSGK
jgi:hypothetical protein